MGEFWSAASAELALLVLGVVALEPEGSIVGLEEEVSVARCGVAVVPASVFVTVLMTAAGDASVGRARDGTKAATWVAPGVADIAPDSAFAPGAAVVVVLAPEVADVVVPVGCSAALLVASAA